MNGIIQYMVSYDWLLSLSLMFSRPSTLSLSVSTSLLIPCVSTGHFVYLLICPWRFGLLPPFSCLNKAAVNLFVRKYLNTCFQVFRVYT